MNDDIKKELKGILDEYKSGLIGKADFEAKMKAIEDKVDALDQTKSIDEIREIIKEQGRTISLMQKSTVSSENEAQEKIKAFFSGKENIDAVKGGRTVSIEIEMKAEAAAMTTTTAAVPIAAFNTEVVPGIAAAATEPNAILPRLQKGTTSSPTIKWINRKDPDGGSAFIAEGTLKPLMSWGYEEETSTTEYRNQLTNGVYRQDTEMGNIQMSFTIGQYDYETKAAFMGGTGSETSWKRARGVTRIEKCMIALTEDNQYCVFPKASVIARNTNNEGAVGIGVAAAALEPDNTAVSSEYWFDSSEVDVE